MSLFETSNQLSTVDIKGKALSLAEGISAIAVLISTIDENVAREEISIIIALKNLKCFQAYSDDDVYRMLKGSTALLRSLSSNEYIELAVAAIPQEMRASVFTIAADIACSDGALPQSEQQLLDTLYQKLGVTQAQGLEIMRVMQLRHKY